MAKERVLIVEDEAIVAADLETTLQKLGFTVVSTAATGEIAVEKAEATKPDLVLMDIRLKGEMDGIDAAEQITAQFNIPVVYLTAYADESTLERAKTTMPYGYILKPFQENDIRAAVEVALYKHQMEGMLSSIQSWHASALQNIPEAVVATDKHGDLTFMNARAESLLGWTLRELCGKPISKIFTFPVTPEHMLAVASPSPTGTAASLLTKDGRTLRIQHSTAFTKDMQGQTTGLLIVFHPAVNGPGTADPLSANPAGKQ